MSWKGDIHAFGLTQCAVCNELMHQSEAKVKTFYRNQQQVQEHLCSDACAETWLSQMRQEGM